MDPFVSASLQVLFDRIASRSFVDFFGVLGLSSAPLNKLKISLLAVNAVLNDAEEKQMTNLAVKVWLDELKDVAYDADDLLDDIATEASRYKFEAESHTNMDQVRNAISTHLNQFIEGIKSKIDEILDKLEYIIKQKNVLGLKEIGLKLSQKLPTTPLIEKYGVFGRDDDRERIFHMLLSNDASENELCVITIVGMGGIGKTTLAQLVYNADTVNACFDVKVWVCVSVEFDVVRITKTILEAITFTACDINDLGLLQVRLEEILRKKRFLLILDDVWNAKYSDWNVLQRSFRFAVKKSRIIVTTRNDNVASIIGTTPIYRLEQLSDENCLFLFEKHAFYNENSSKHPHLQAIAKEIAKKCKGLPLAAQTLGGLLRSKRGVEEWNKILKSNIWDFSNEESDILPALRLSYHYLPSKLKRCFAYCSIFPKNYEFKKEELVLLWMAEDFLQHPVDKNKTLEEVGAEFFHDLISRSFFQRSSGDESCFVMHDLVNDLAKFVSGEFCFRLEDDNSEEVCKKTRHLSFLRTRYDAFKKFEPFSDANYLRTFLPLNLSLYQNFRLSNKVLLDLLPTLRCLRVLSLSHYNTISELPESIGNLKHLRYLDLSFSAIRKLPNSTSALHNLQTLMMFECHSLTELPMDMWRLVNLRHLNISGTKLKEMPMFMSSLRNLQTLSSFTVGKRNGSMITEIGKFQHLGGALRILELQNVGHPRNGVKANLKDKECLDELVLEWSTETEDSHYVREVLDKLQPHANLKKLTIKYYGSTRFPGWLGDPSFCNMVYLHLENCKYCFSLPPLGQLPCLKNLSIVGFDSVEIVGLEFYGNTFFSTVVPFSSLEILRFEEMPDLVELFCLGDESGGFPCLRELYIKKCPKLSRGLPRQGKEEKMENTSSLPSVLPSLTKLVISECQQVIVASLLVAPAICEVMLNDCISKFKRLPPLLHRLVIERCSSLESLPEGMRGINSCLQDLVISDCSSLKYFPQDGLPTTLKTLHIEKCVEFEFPTHQQYPSLESLFIDSSCDSLISFPLSSFPKLIHLRIDNCRNLVFLWIEGRHDEDLTSLTDLTISLCPKLLFFSPRRIAHPQPDILLNKHLREFGIVARTDAHTPHIPSGFENNWLSKTWGLS